MDSNGIKTALAKKAGTEPTPADLSENYKDMVSFKGVESKKVSGFLTKFRTQFENIMKDPAKVDALIQIATNTIVYNPKLAECSARSMIGALMSIVTLGFNPDPALQQFYLIPRWNSKTGMNEISFQIGYKGMIDIICRNEDIVDVYTDIVYKNDEFVYSSGLHRDIKHIHNIDDPGEMRCAYVVIRYKSTELQSFEVVTKKTIEGVRERSESYKSHKTKGYSTPWVGLDEPAMWRKTAVRQLWNWVRKEVTPLQNAVIAETDKESIIFPEMFDNDGKELKIKANEIKDEDTADYTIVEEPKSPTGKIKSKTEPEYPEPTADDENPDMPPEPESYSMFEKKR